MKKYKKPLIIYDGSCGLCTGGTKWLHYLDWFNRFEIAPYQDKSLPSLFPKISLPAYEEAVHVIFPNEKVYKGADALRIIFLRMPLTFIFGIIAAIPPMPWILRRLYPILARNRYRLGGRCEIATPTSSRNKKENAV